MGKTRLNQSFEGLNCAPCLDDRSAGAAGNVHQFTLAPRLTIIFYIPTDMNGLRVRVVVPFVVACTSQNGRRCRRWQCSPAKF